MQHQFALAKPLPTIDFGSEPMTRGERLRADARVAEAKRLLREALQEHSAELQQVQAPDPALTDQYEADLANFGQLRGGNLYYPYLGSGAGSGAHVELADGSVKLDFIGGIGVHGWGHADPAVVEACVDAALEDLVMQGNLQQNEVSRDVCAAFLRLADDSELAHCFLTSSGAMANENAIKLAFHKRQPANRVLAFRRCFAGRTLGMAYITDKAAYRDGLPQSLDVDYIDFVDQEDVAGSTARAMQQLDDHCQRFPGKHAVFIAELIQGEGGYNPGEAEYFRTLFTACRERGISIFIDEVQTFGRLERPFAYQYFGLADLVDIVSIGKITQVCATLYKADHKPKPGLISQTFTSSTAALHVGRYVLQQMADGNYYGPDGRVAAIRKRFVDHLEAIAQRHPGQLSGPYGCGVMLACTPYGGDRERVLDLAKRLFTAGLICFIAGANPCRLRFLPLIGVVSDADIDHAAALLEQCLQEGI